MHWYCPLGKLVWEFIGLSLSAIHSSKSGLDCGDDISLKEGVITGHGVLSAILGIVFHVNIFINFVFSAYIGRIQWFFPQHRDVIL